MDEQVAETSYRRIQCACKERIGVYPCQCGAQVGTEGEVCPLCKKGDHV